MRPSSVRVAPRTTEKSWRVTSSSFPSRVRNQSPISVDIHSTMKESAKTRSGKFKGFFILSLPLLFAGLGLGEEPTYRKPHSRSALHRRRGLPSFCLPRLFTPFSLSNMTKVLFSLGDRLYFLHRVCGGRRSNGPMP